MVPALLGLGALWGVVSISDANDKIHRANEFNAKAAAIAEQSRQKVEVANNNMNTSLDTLGKTEVDIMSDRINNFVSLMSSIYDDFEYRRDYTGLEKLERTGFRRKVIEELQAMTNKAIELGSTPKLKELAGEECSFSSVGLFGAGALALGLEVIAAPAMLLYGMMKSDEANAAFYEAKTRLDEANLYREKCLNLCVLFEAISQRGKMLNDLLQDLDRYLSPAVYKMRNIVSRRGYDLDDYPEQDFLSVYLAYQITNTVKIIIETPIVQNDWSINPMLDNSIEIGQQNVKLLKSAN